MITSKSAALYPIGYIFNGIANIYNTKRTLEANREFARQQRIFTEQENALARENQLKIAKLTIANQVDIEERRNLNANELEAKRQHFQERMEFLRIDNYKSTEEARKSFQRELAKMNESSQQRLNKFIKQVDLQISKSNLAFQKWRFQQEILLQRDIAKFNRNTQIQIANLNRENALKQVEAAKLFNEWPLNLTPTEILEGTDQAPPLRVITCPPKISFIRWEGKENNIKYSFDTIVRRELGEMLRMHYPMQQGTHKVVFLDQIWSNLNKRGNAAIKSLFKMLRSEPMLVLETDITRQPNNVWKCDIRASYWGVGAMTYHEDCHSLTVNISENMLGVDEESFLDSLTLAHKILAGTYIDVHYFNLDWLPPKLPTILNELFSKDLILSQEAKDELIEPMFNTYHGIYAASAYDQNLLIPSNLLSLANSFLDLPSKKWSERILKNAVRLWGSQKGINTSDEDSIERVLQSTRDLVSRSDAQFIEELKQITQKVFPEAK